MSVQNITIIFPGDGFVNISSPNVFPSVWGCSASLGNSGFYLFLYGIYFVCFIWLLRTIKHRILQQQNDGGSFRSTKGEGGVMKKNHIVMFSLAGLMVAIQCVNLVIRIVNDILFITGRLTIERNERVSYSHYLAIWIMAAFSTFFMFLNFVMLFVILFFVQMVFWRTAATMRAISKKAFKNIRIFTIVTIILFAIACFVILTLVGALIPLTKFNIMSKSTNATVNYIFLGIILLLYSKDTVAIIVSGVLVIKTIRKSIQKIKNVTHKQKKMENPFIVTFCLLIGLIICIFLQILAVVLGATLSTNQDELKFVWHFINCAGILIFSTLTLALFYPMFIQTESVIKELHLDDTRSNLSNISSGARGNTTIRDRNSMIVPSTANRIVESKLLSPSDVTFIPISSSSWNETPPQSGSSSGGSTQPQEELNFIASPSSAQNIENQSTDLAHVASTEAVVVTPSESTTPVTVVVE